MSTLVFLAGSSSPSSRSSFVAAALAAHAASAGLAIRSFSLGDFDPADIVYGRADVPAFGAFLRAVAEARAIVLSTPVYKGTYAGVLKAIVDLIPPDVLAGKVVLGVATARVSAHAPHVDRAYRDLFGFFRAQALETLFVRDDEFASADGRTHLVEKAAERVATAARGLIEALGDRAAEEPRAAPASARPQTPR